MRIREVAAAALEQSEQVLRQWLPAGKRQGSEWVSVNPTRADSSPGSFSVNIESGAWADFATYDRGGDLVALVAYLEPCSQKEAAKRLADFLGLSFSADTRETTETHCSLKGKTSPKRIRETPKTETQNPPTSAKVSATRPILPIPAQASPLPAAHPAHGKPTATWIYRNAEGQPLLIVARFDPPGQRKQICPLTYWPDGWRWKSLPVPRPLYRLDQIAARPDVPVLITEGEKASDAAALLFPNAVTTTAMNGAQSPDKADWSPLKGRVVFAWPDHDEPGQGYAAAVAKLARAAGAASVQALDLAALSVDPKTGEARTLPKGWDAADAVADGWTAEALADLHRAGRLFKLVADDKPAPRGKEKSEKLPRFESRPDGLFYLGMHYNKQSHQFEAAPPLWVASPLEVTARTRDASGENWGRLLEFKDPDGALHRWAMPMNMLRGDGQELRGELLRQGLLISSNPDARRRLTDYLQEARPEQHARCVLRTGWHDRAFVFPHRTLGDEAEPVLFQADTLEGNPYRERAALSEWRDSVAALCIGNSRLVFSVSAAFAAVLLGPCEEDGGGFHLRGDSSCGKTTALRVAASVFGGLDYMQRWRATDNGLEALAAMYSDTLLPLDELAQMDPRAAGEAAYMLANGSGKSRADRNGNARGRKTWRVLFLSAGEVSLADHVAQAGRRTHAGQEVRMADIPADAGAGLGLFEELHGRPDGHTLSRDLCEAAARHYGTAGPAFIEAVIPRLDELPGSIARMREQFMADVLTDDAGGQARRAAARFTLVAVAGEFAAVCGIVPWQKGEAKRAAARRFADWVAGRGGAGNAEIHALLRQVRVFFELHGESRFTPWNRAEDDHAPRTSNRAGFVKIGSDESPLATTYYVLPEVFRGELCAGHDHRDAEKVLVARGWIKPGSDGRATRAERLPGYGKPTRCYVIPTTGMED